MHLCTIIVRDWKPNIKTLVGVLNLLAVVFIFPMPAEARDYHIRASDGESYIVTIGEDSDIKNFSVQKTDGEILRGVTEAERTTAAELCFAAMFFSDVLPFYSPKTPIEDWEEEIIKIARSGLIRLIGKQGIDMVGNAFINGLTGAAELILTGNLPAIIEGWIPGAVNDAIQNEAEHRLLIDAANLALGAAREASVHEQVLRGLWSSYETRSLTIPIDEVNAGWASFYKLAAYYSLVANLIDKYLKDPDSDVELGLGGLDNIVLNLIPYGQALKTVAQATVESLQIVRTATEILETAISVSYTEAHIQHLRDINESANSKIHEGASSRITEGQSQSRVRLEQVGFFQPMEVVQQPEENAGDTDPKNDVANGVGVTAEFPVQDEPPDDREAPDRPDLVVTNIEVYPDTVHPGERFRVSAAVENVGRGRNVSVRFYRSSDSTYSTDDEEITGWHRSLGVLRSGDEPRNVHANLDAPMEPGDYYYIVRVDTARDEIKTSNNSNSIKITVLPPAAPDLVVSLTVPNWGRGKITSLPGNEYFIEPDKFFRLEATVENQGEAESEATSIHFYRSLDPIPSSEEDDIIETKEIRKLRDPDSRFYNPREQWSRIRAPGEPGAYYYYARVDSVSGERDTNNNHSNVVTLNVRGPDLVVDTVEVDYFSRTDTTVRPDGIFELYATIQNRGTKRARPKGQKLHYYVSSDATLSDDDTKAAMADDIFSLDPNEISKKFSSGWIRTPYKSGFFYALVCVDSVENESDTDNNCFEPIKITVRNVAPTPDPDEPDSSDLSSEVSIPDENLRAAVRTALELAEDDTLTLQEMQRLKRLDAPRTDIRNLIGLEHATNLTNLSLYGNKISDITPLTNLTILRQLHLDNNKISDLSPLANLTAFRGQLTFKNNEISDLSPLANLTAITRWLDLRGNQISDISPLANLTALTQLYLDNNQISDISPLANLTALTQLFIGNNQINDITPLKDLTAITFLKLNHNQISDITPLKDLTALRTLHLDNNRISDISPLANLTALTRLFLDNNQIGDITHLKNLTSLDWLYLHNNQIIDVTPLEGLAALGDLLLSNNRIGDVAPLENLTSLHRLWLKNNPIADLAPLRRLKEENPSMRIDIDINVDLNNVQAAPAVPMLPAETALLSNYPNPFNPETWIPYQLAKAADVTLTIYDVKGIVIRRLVLGHQPAGFYQSRTRAGHWDGQNELGEKVANGLYFYTFTAGDFTATRKMLIRK